MCVWKIHNCVAYSAIVHFRWYFGKKNCVFLLFLFISCQNTLARGKVWDRERLRCPQLSRYPVWTNHENWSGHRCKYLKLIMYDASWLLTKYRYTMNIITYTIIYLCWNSILLFQGLICAHWISDRYTIMLIYKKWSPLKQLLTFHIVADIAIVSVSFKMDLS